MTTLFDIAQNWLNQDPDAETHAELTALLTRRKMVMKKHNLNYKLALVAVYNLVLRGFVDHYKQALWV